jgi:putative DNA primase/helicase
MSAAPAPQEHDPEAQHLAEVPVAAVEAFALTDLGNAERLVSAHGRDLRHVPGLGWHRWDGRCWQRDEDGEPMRRAKLAARAILHDAANCDDDALRKTIVKWARASEAEPRLRAAVSLAASEPQILAGVDELDADPWALNALNGTIDLRTGKLRGHRRTDLLSKLAPAAYDPKAKCPQWLSFLQVIFDGNAELITYVQRWAGYSLTGSIREQALVVCWGGGSNGKSTLLGTLRRLLGDYAEATPTSTLLEQRQGDGIPNDVARLRGARLVTASETSSGRNLNEERVKDITGGDAITARYMRGEWFSFEPQFKLWLSTNHLPRIRGTDHAIWRRLSLVPFAVTIPDAAQDKELPAKLAGELPGILAWAVRGCLDWQQQGLAAPAAVSAATDGYRVEQDLLGRFLAERCEIDPRAEVQAADLWDAYCKWAEANRERTGTQTSFGRELTERGHEGAKHGGNRTRRGLRLRPEAGTR